jgi:hypothetical protein
MRYTFFSSVIGGILPKADEMTIPTLVLFFSNAITLDGMPERETARCLCGIQNGWHSPNYLIAILSAIYVL